MVISASYSYNITVISITHRVSLHEPVADPGLELMDALLGRRAQHGVVHKGAQLDVGVLACVLDHRVACLEAQLLRQRNALGSCACRFAGHLQSSNVKAALKVRKQ